MKKKTIIWILASFLILVLGFAAFTAYYYETVDLPEMELREARDRITQAKQVNADKYSPKNLDMAETYYDSAITEWKTQNKKLFFLREHERAKVLAIHAASYAGKAIEASLTGSSQLKDVVSNKMHQLNALIDEYNEVYAHVPQAEKTQKDVFRARMLMTEAFKAYGSDDLQRTEKIIREASALLEPAMKGLKLNLSMYFEQLPKWMDWVKSALKKNTGGKMLIVFDKYAHKLQVYKGGKLMHTFNAEFGPNWIGDKHYRGDNATPEGKYRVSVKKSGRETKYYKALLLDYPNAEDKQRFDADKKAGSLPRGARIGSLIEIHGDGGKGVDWTNGCVAIKNSDMDILYGLVPVNSSIIIVGSLRSLNEIRSSK